MATQQDLVKTLSSEAIKLIVNLNKLVEVATRHAELDLNNRIKQQSVKNDN